jgi:hypothetical protein
MTTPRGKKTLPSVQGGQAYMVANDDYLKHLVKYVDEDEVCEVVNIKATLTIA